MKYWVAIPAAGQGQRLGSPIPKQYLELAGRTVIEWALLPFLLDARCQGIAVAVAAADSRWHAVRERIGARFIHAQGGAERSDSVAAALDALARHGADPAECVLVHDAARPCLTQAELDALLLAAAGHDAGALLALPLADTLKREQRAGGSPRVAATEPRDGLWRALTPQAFRLGALREALAAAVQAGRKPTDESQAIEWMGSQPVLVPGEATNIKVTTVEDLALARSILAARAGTS